MPVQNPYTYGNAWFVDRVSYVKTANEELDQLGKIDPRHEAVADQKFEQLLGKAVEQDTTSVVSLTSYEPNRLKYDLRSGKGGIVVFSEIYYPGWTATIDGQPADHFRVDYMLRALNVPAGHHQIHFEFAPDSVRRGDTLSMVCIIILYAATLLVVLSALLGRKRLRRN